MEQKLFWTLFIYYLFITLIIKEIFSNYILIDIQ
jgi:hypothetical protein